ncbi:MAG: hypothetical protein GX102_15480 [Porphyromonadaceae bacterium]|nr:hypothetical protein [Porphyromonadaceae bacterium]
MFNKKTIFCLAVLALLTSCNKQIDNDNTIIINNPVLRDEIAEYIKYTNGHVKDSAIVVVYFSVVNDSTNRFEITYSQNAVFFMQNPFLFTAKVSNKTVFFSMKENIVKKGDITSNFFSNDTTVIYDILKKYLPKEYKRQLEYNKTGIYYIDEYILDDTENILDLTFVKDSLIKKEMRGGLIQGIY